jgi:hypothetical protein
VRRAEDAADRLQENRRERTLSLIQDDFSAPDCDRQWQTARSSSRAAKLDCTDGDFRITLHDPRYYQQAVVNLISPQDGVSVEVIASPRGRGNVYFGVACLSSGQTGFVFYLSSKDRYSILKRTRANGPPKTIEKGRLSSPEQ